MDSAAAPSTTASSTNKLSKLAVFLSTFRRNQEWSLPDSVIYYMVKNPSSSKCYQKLIQACKYFFIKNPILVFKRLYIWAKGYPRNFYLDGKNVDLPNVSSKLWVTNINVDVYNYSVQYFSRSILPKIYKGDIQILQLKSQNMFFKDFIWLASKCEGMDLNKVTIKNNYGSIVTLERIIEALPNIKSFEYNFEYADPKMITSQIVQELVKIPHFHILDNLYLFDVPESFNLDDLYSYIKRNKRTKIHLEFSIRHKAYKKRLQEIVNDIVQTENHDYKVPYISFYRMKKSSFDKLRKLHNSD